MSDSIESVQLAPNGVVTDIYPANENEAGKIDLIHDKDRGKISCYARDNHTIKLIRHMPSKKVIRGTSVFFFTWFTSFCSWELL